MNEKPEFTNASEALDWCRGKCLERHKDLNGSVPPLEMFLMGMVEVMAAQAIAIERLADVVERHSDFDIKMRAEAWANPVKR